MVQQNHNLDCDLLVYNTAYACRFLIYGSNLLPQSSFLKIEAAGSPEICGFHSDIVEDLGLLGCDTVSLGEW